MKKTLILACSKQKGIYIKAYYGDFYKPVTGFQSDTKKQRIHSIEKGETTLTGQIIVINSNIFENNTKFCMHLQVKSLHPFTSLKEGIKFMTVYELNLHTSFKVIFTYY